MVVRKILEETLTAGTSSVIFTDADIPNSLIRVFSSNADIIPISRTLSGTSLTVTYEPQTSNLDVAVEIVKAGLDIVDDLTSTDTDKALSAKQGKLLKDDVDTLTNTINNLDIPDNITDLDDVNVTSIQDGQLLAWDNDTSKFVNVTPQEAQENIIYSTTPQKVGKWTDNRDVYRVVFDMGSDISIANDSLTTTTINASSMGILLDTKAIYSTGVTVYNIMGNINDNLLRFQADRNNSFISARYFIVTYVERGE